MKKVFDYIYSFYNGYSKGSWLLIAVFMSVSVFLNYYFGINGKIYAQSDFISFLLFALMYGLHWFGAFFILKTMNPLITISLNKKTFLIVGMSVLSFAFRAIADYHKPLIDCFSTEGHYRLNQLIFNDLFRFLYLFVPVFVTWFLLDKKKMPLYGFSLKNHTFKLYFIMLACMLPLIIGASFLGDFLSYYPRFKTILSEAYSNVDIVLFELFYGLDFVAIELFFRGFLIIGLIKITGIHAIVPMASFYLSIHYGKPVGESISSFFGGCLLGLMSFHTQSIVGGIMVHVGIAWMMELGATIGNWLKG